MSEPLRFDAEDPRWTAYVLGELEATERAQCEEVLATDATASEHVAALEQTAQRLRFELEAELQGVPRLDRTPSPLPRSRSLRVRRIVLVGATAAAVIPLAVVLGFTLRSSGSESKQREDPPPPEEVYIGRAGGDPAASVIDLRSLEDSSSLGFDNNGSGLATSAGQHPASGIFFDQGTDRLLALGYVAQDRWHKSIPQDFAILQESQARTESYANVEENAFRFVSAEPLSTFSIDVDTASYANVRRFLERGQDPPRDAVRIEELINAFDYADPEPSDGRPFSVTLEMARCPWKPEHRLARIGLQGKRVPRAERPASNLVFLIDVSGSMDAPNKLALVQRSLGLLVEELDARDRVALVVYAGASGLVLPSTSCGERSALLQAIERLKAGGSTNGGAGIELAYATARESFLRGGANRVILCTDGDFNVGITESSQLVGLVRECAQDGIFLTVLGFGMGNLKDAMLEQLADQGNGFYGYVDDLREARKLFVDELSGTLVTIAKDVKIQVEFNPAQVASYRLLGYENRALANEDFANDAKDAGEIGAGHDVTALYEIALRDEPRTEIAEARPSESPLRYQETREVAPRAELAHEVLHVRLRYKEPAEEQSRLLEQTLVRSERSFDEASENLRFAASVALFGMLLRASEHAGSGSFATVAELASGALGADPRGERKAFLELVRRKR